MATSPTMGSSTGCLDRRRWLGGRVQVRERHGQLAVWNQGQLLLMVAKRVRPHEVVPHPEQFKSVLPTAAARAAQTPIGHQVTAPLVAQRSLAEYDVLYQVEARS